jgi:hypothetical protein
MAHGSGARELAQRLRARRFVALGCGGDRDHRQARDGFREKMATPAGFEPATFSLEGCCSIP